ncbi:hypothetical protein PV327_005577 [Microctonus hyperodae]|uniref:Uncharacterized protein n=1 Tax=Microctonus hyperodae TaxID=165561 RepID=A0AA39G2E7_MICHY|nr:hypothetical protein PV327_005577 [Microctonus hyperodae]
MAVTINSRGMSDTTTHRRHGGSLNDHTSAVCTYRRPSIAMSFSLYITWPPHSLLQSKSIGIATTNLDDTSSCRGIFHI